jgi:hypothetical protein
MAGSAKVKLSVVQCHFERNIIVVFKPKMRLSLLGRHTPFANPEFIRTRKPRALCAGFLLSRTFGIATIQAQWMMILF